MLVNRGEEVGKAARSTMLALSEPVISLRPNAMKSTTTSHILYARFVSYLRINPVGYAHNLRLSAYSTAASPWHQPYEYTMLTNEPTTAAAAAARFELTPATSI